MKAQTRALARKALDVKFASVRRGHLFDMPHRGWVRALRDALGMSARQLGQRMGIKPQSVLEMEKNEAAGAVRLETLRRAAQALDCELVYVLVPKRSLEEMVWSQAQVLATHMESRVQRTMALESQDCDHVEIGAATFVDDPKLWDYSG